MANPVNTARLMGQLEMMRAMAAQEVGSLEPNSQTLTSPAGQFAELLKAQVDNVNRAQDSARNLAEAFELGEPGVDLVDVMIAAQKSRVQFEALAEVRNKLLGAYQEVMSMQV
ncbi:MAG: flagellar hook-basal body complex protein FliE [Pseudomonadota bacterium]